MDLNQRKLNKSEWESIEIPVSKTEQDILHLIISGFNDVNIRINNNNSIFTFLKIEYSEKMEDYLFNKYIRKRYEKIENEIKILFPSYKNIKIDANIKPNSIDRARLDRFNNESIENIELLLFILIFTSLNPDIISCNISFSVFDTGISIVSHSDLFNLRWFKSIILV